MDWEKLPNGKYRPKKQFKKSEDGKYQFDDPKYKYISELKMKKVKIFCENCNDFYNLTSPCIHHLPDDYNSNKKKMEYRKARKNVNIIDDNNENIQLTFEQEDI